MSASLSAELASRTLALCRIPSPTGNERALADFVEAWAHALNPAMDVIRIGHSLVVAPPDAKDSGKPGVLLLGHLDTVPPHASDGAARLEAGRIHGLGSSDMKGGLAVMMSLAEQLPRDTATAVAYVFYEREEGPYSDSGLGPLLTQVPFLRRAKFAVALEPTDGVVQVGCVGSIHATVRFEGKSAHSARPWQGENAVHKAGALLAELAVRPRTEVNVGGFTFYEVMSITRAQGGRARNVVPDVFEMNLNYRFAPGKTREQAEGEVRALVGGRAALELTDFAPAGRVCSDNPHFAKLVSATGAPAAAKQAWTDVGRLSQAGLDAVSFGPGETAQAHQARESAPVEPLGAAFEALRQFFEETKIGA